MAQKLLSQVLFPAFLPAIPAISWPRRDSFRSELATKLAIVFDYVRTPLAGVKINLILSLHKYRLAEKEGQGVLLELPSDTSGLLQAISPRGSL